MGEDNGVKKDAAAEEKCSQKCERESGNGSQGSQRYSKVATPVTLARRSRVAPEDRYCQHPCLATALCTCAFATIAIGVGGTINEEFREWIIENVLGAGGSLDDDVEDGAEAAE